MPDSQDPKQVNNNDLSNAQFGGGFINADIVNAQRIGGDIYNIYLGEQGTSNNTPSSPQRKKRSQQERDSLEKVYTQQRQKVEKIRNAWVLETTIRKARSSPQHSIKNSTPGFSRNWLVRSKEYLRWQMLLTFV